MTDTGRNFLAENTEYAEKEKLADFEMLQEYVVTLEISLTRTETVIDPKTDLKTKIVQRDKPYVAAQKIINHPDIRIIRDKDTKITWCYTPKTGVYCRYGEDLVRLIALTKSNKKGDITYANNVTSTVEALTVGSATPSKKIAVKKRHPNRYQR